MDTASALVAFGAGYSIGACMVACVAAVRARSRARWATAVAAIMAVVILRAIVERWAPQGIRGIVDEAGMTGRVVLGVGFVAALPLFSPTRKSPGTWQGDLLGLLSLGAVLSAVALVVFKAKVGLSSAERDVRVPPQFHVRLVGDLPYVPLRVAAEGADVFVSFEDVVNGHLNGGVLAFRSKAASFEMRIAVSSPFLFRSHGLAVSSGKLYVSRSGLSPHAVHGQVYYDGIGAVTRLEDRDGDGKYEYWHDVLTGLSGVRGPDTLHQSNGVAVAQDGTIYVANSHDHNRSLDPHRFAGAVVRLLPGAAEPEVFARGFRNPWALAFGPNGALLATDNDIEENPGDEVNLVRSGLHYGHPFVVPGEAGGGGFEGPLINEPNRVLAGLAFVPRGAWPSPFDASLYVSDLLSGDILRLELEETPNGGQRVRSKTKFASAPSPIDLTFSNGKLYVLSRYHKRLYLLEPR
jgi:glucose/arabinose dehydrogenase